MSEEDNVLLELKKRLEDSEKQLTQLEAKFGSVEIKFDSEVRERIFNTCFNLGFSFVKLIRAPHDYYDWQLERRRDFLSATSINDLCKTILMENTRATTEDCSNPLNSRWYAVIIQYTSRLDTKKLEKFVRGLTSGSIRNYHFRSAKDKDLVSLTNSEYNGVCPIGNKVNIPIILSERLTSQSGFMWVGGGEPDLKLGLYLNEFIKITGCFVADICDSEFIEKPNDDPVS